MLHPSNGVAGERRSRLRVFCRHGKSRKIFLILRIESASLNGPFFNGITWAVFLSKENAGSVALILVNDTVDILDGFNEV